MSHRIRIVLGAVALAALTAPIGARAAGPAGACAPGAKGTDWPVYGHDNANSRAADGNGITAETAGALTQHWNFNVANQGGSGTIQSTPTVADGCVFFATDAGDVFALNADDGTFVWHTHYSVAETRLGGVISGAVAIDGDLALVDVSDAGHPFLAALDRTTGHELWRAVVDDRYGSFVIASPIPFGDGLVFVGFAGDEYAPEARGGYAIVNERDHSVSAHYTIPDADFAKGYWGGAVWSTAAIDADGHYAYAGAGNPASHDKEHQNTDALLKIDVDPASAKFGQIVDVYKGNSDQYFPGLDRQPVCQTDPDVTYGDAWSLTCVQFDLDFGASPSLFRDARGNTVVAAQQKAGVFHAVYADHMEQAWTALIGTPCFVCNSASPAVHDGNVVAVGTEPGQMLDLNADTGGYRWVSPLADAVHYESVSISDGVAFALDFFGNLNAVNLATGVPLLKHNLALDTGASALGTTSAGVSIARDQLFAPAGSFLVTYH
jgi:outer membrane protein assembly factor BamB